MRFSGRLSPILLGALLTACPGKTDETGEPDTGVELDLLPDAVVPLSHADVALASQGEVESDGAWVQGAGPIVAGTDADALLVRPISSTAVLLSSPVDGAGLLDSAAAEFEGFSTTVVGDQNLDGIGDIAICSDSATSYHRMISVFLHWGPFEGVYTEADADIVMAGTEDYHDSSCVLDAAGDLDADGFSDILLVDGDHGHGAIYAISGPVTASGMVETLSTVVQFVDTIYDPYVEGAWGAGDTNGDGYDDVVGDVRDSQADGSHVNSLYLFLGPIASDGPLDQSAAVAHIDTTERHTGPTFEAADLDGDGRSDLIWGLPTEQDFIRGGEVAQDPSFVSIYPGPVEGALTPDDASLRIRSNFNYFGGSLGVMDLDADGSLDLIAGANQYDDGSLEWEGEPHPDPGRVFAFFGPLGVGDRGAGEADLVFEGGAFDYDGGNVPGCAGRSVSSAGDMNGDGLEDLAVGAASVSEAPPTGAAYLLYGREGYREHWEALEEKAGRH